MKVTMRSKELVKKLSVCTNNIPSMEDHVEGIIKQLDAAYALAVSEYNSKGALSKLFSSRPNREEIVDKAVRRIMSGNAEYYIWKGHNLLKTSFVERQWHYIQKDADVLLNISKLALSMDNTYITLSEDEAHVVRKWGEEKNEHSIFH